VVLLHASGSDTCLKIIADFSKEDQRFLQNRLREETFQA
jgi:hypothetical protein